MGELTRISLYVVKKIHGKNKEVAASYCFWAAIHWRWKARVKNLGESWDKSMFSKPKSEIYNCSLLCLCCFQLSVYFLVTKKGDSNTLKFLINYAHAIKENIYCKFWCTTVHPKTSTLIKSNRLLSEISFSL